MFHFLVMFPHCVSQSKPILQEVGVVLSTESPLIFLEVVVSQAHVPMNLNVCCLVTKKMCFHRP